MATRFFIGLFISFFAVAMMMSPSEPLRTIGRLTVTGLMLAIAIASETTSGKIVFAVLALVNLVITLGRAGLIGLKRSPD
jgi:hypothetical protein